VLVASLARYASFADAVEARVADAVCYVVGAGGRRGGGGSRVLYGRPRMGLAVETPLILYLDAGGPAGWPGVPRVADTLLQARGLCRQGRVSRTALLASSYAPRCFEAFEIYRIISKQ
jgi:hypothetical protein